MLYLCPILSYTMVSIHQAVRRLNVESQVSKPEDWVLQWSYPSVIWKEPR